MTASGRLLTARRQAEALAAPLPPLAVEARRIAATVALGVHGRRRPGVGETFWEYRPHRAEDGAGRIDWRRSARSDALYVRENEHEASQTVLFWRDGRPGMDAGPERDGTTKRARASVLMIALADLLTRGGERVAVIGESAAARSGRIGFERVAHRLADGPGALDSLAAAGAQRFSRLVVASDFYDDLDVWRDRLAGLAARGAQGVVLQVTAGEEEEFPFTGREAIRAPDASGSAAGSERIFGRIQSVRASYQRRLAAQRAGLRDLARRLGWGFVSSRTDAPATPALLALYAALSPEPQL